MNRLRVVDNSDHGDEDRFAHASPKVYLSYIGDPNHTVVDGIRDIVGGEITKTRSGDKSAPVSVSILRSERGDTGARAKTQWTYVRRGILRRNKPETKNVEAELWTSVEGLALTGLCGYLSGLRRRKQIHLPSSPIPQIDISRPRNQNAYIPDNFKIATEYSGNLVVGESLIISSMKPGEVSLIPKDNSDKPRLELPDVIDEQTQLLGQIISSDLVARKVIDAIYGSSRVSEKLPAIWDDLLKQSPKDIKDYLESKRFGEETNSPS